LGKIENKDYIFYIYVTGNATQEEELMMGKLRIGVFGAE